MIKNIALEAINKYMKEAIQSSKKRIEIAAIDNSPLICVISIFLIYFLHEDYFIQVLMTFSDNYSMRPSKILIYPCQLIDEQYHHQIFKNSLKNRNCLRFKRFCFNLLDNDFISISKENIERNLSFSITSLLFKVQNFLRSQDILLESALFYGENNTKIYFSEEKNQKNLLNYKVLLEENRLNIYIQKVNELLLLEEEFNQAYQKIKQMVTKNKKPVKFPVCITLGGQPGAGKSNIYNIAKKRFSNNIVELNCDAFRVFHPYYHQINKIYGKEDVLKTNPFVFKVVDLLIEELSEEKYNLIIESSLNSPYSALQNGKTLPPKGYKVELHIMATPKDVSWQGTIDRYNKELKNGGSPRAVSKEFHDKVVKNICYSLDVVKKSGLMSNILIFNRNKKCLYNQQKDKNTNPCLLLFSIINAYSSKNDELYLKSLGN